jgi:hypothetical protein
VLHIQDGELGSAQAVLERLTESNPESELGWRRLLELHLLRHDLPATQRAWPAYRSALAEVQAAPSVEMLAIAEDAGILGA